MTKLESLGQLLSPALVHKTLVAISMKLEIQFYFENKLQLMSNEFNGMKRRKWGGATPRVMQRV